MPKFYNDPTIELQRLNENMWFKFNQKLLLGIANTKAGRDLLCIPQEYPQIVLIKKNCVHALVKNDGTTATLIADFRIGAKFANVIRYRWDAFNAMARYYVNADLFASPLTRYAMSVHAATLTAYPDPNVETTTVDGVSKRGTIGTGTVWATTRDHTDGSSAQDSGTTGGAYQGKWLFGDSYPWIDINRGFFLFDTSSLTSGASISDTVMSVRGSGTVYADYGGANSKFFFAASTPASNTAISTADYDQIGRTKYDSGISIASMSTAAYNDFTFNATGIAAVSKTSITKLSFQTGWDIDNTSPSFAFNDSGDGVYIILADTAGTSTDPKLVVTYTVATARARLTLLGVA